MGTFSVWHWAIVLAYLAVYIVPIFAADPGKRLARKPYALRTLATIAVLVVIGTISSLIQSSGIQALVTVVAGYVLAVFLVLWSVHRIQDIEWAKWWCLLFLIPIIGVVFWLILLFTPGKRVSAQRPLRSIDSLLTDRQSD